VLVKFQEWPLEIKPSPAERFGDGSSWHPLPIAPSLPRRLKPELSNGVIAAVNRCATPTHSSAEVNRCATPTHSSAEVNRYATQKQAQGDRAAKVYHSSHTV